MMRKQKPRRQFVYLTVALILILAGMIGGLQMMESAFFSSVVPEQTTGKKKTINRNGVDYFPRQDITVVMVLGIDEIGPAESSNSYRNTGEADSVMLAILDHKEENITVLALNRDTMLDMDILGVRGEYAGKSYGQLALAHTYGTGLGDSCENTRNTVSNFLYGINIDYYLSMNMDAISVLNDAVGGVTVNVTDDFSAVDPSITKGEMKLLGQQAINFVRTRKGVSDQLNISRMDRQREYIDGFLVAMREKMEQSDSFALSAYSDISPYIVTDISSNVFSSMLQRYSDYELTEIVSPEGKNVRGEEYMEFYVDEEKLDDLILDLFYAPK